MWPFRAAIASSLTSITAEWCQSHKDCTRNVSLVVCDWPVQCSILLQCRNANNVQASALCVRSSVMNWHFNPVFSHILSYLPIVVVSTCFNKADDFSYKLPSRAKLPHSGFTARITSQHGSWLANQEIPVSSNYKLPSQASSPQCVHLLGPCQEVFAACCPFCWWHINAT